jgi:hypothetical protein
VNLGLFQDCSPLVPMLCLSSPMSNAHYPQIGAGLAQAV